MALHFCGEIRDAGDCQSAQQLLRRHGRRSIGAGLAAQYRHRIRGQPGVIDKVALQYPP